MLAGPRLRRFSHKIDYAAVRSALDSDRCQGTGAGLLRIEEDDPVFPSLDLGVAVESLLAPCSDWGYQQF
jgi:hypothetical protein